jgi:hypothetical protein
MQRRRSNSLVQIAWVLALFTCLCASESSAQTQNPSAYFVVRGNIGNGDQFDPGFPYHFDTGTGGGSKSRTIPLDTLNWGSLSVSASIGAASMTATFQGTMAPVDASRACNIVYGCGWGPGASTQYSGIDVYVFLGPPGTPFHVVQNDSGSLFDSVTTTHACDGGYANAQASSSWAGVSGNVSATSEHGTGGFCGIPVPKSGSSSVSLPFVWDRSSATGPTTITYNGKTYSYAYSAQTVLSLSLYAEQDPDFTATSRGNVTVNIAVTANTPTNSIKLVSVDDVDPNNPVVTYMVTGNVGTVNWGLDGNVTNSLGAPPVGVSTFTVPNIEGLPHSLHLLEIIGTNGGSSYVDSTSLNTSVLPNQTFANTWGIVYNAPSLTHNSVTATGTINASEIIWGLPGQTYDRYISATSAVLTSLLPPDAPNESITTAAPELIVNGTQYLMQEIPSIGNQSFWGAAFGQCISRVPLGACLSGGPSLPVGVFVVSGGAAAFKLSGFTSTLEKGLWVSGPWYFARFPNVFYGILNFTIN